MLVDFPERHAHCHPKALADDGSLQENAVPERLVLSGNDLVRQIIQLFRTASFVGQPCHLFKYPSAKLCLVCDVPFHVLLQFMKSCNRKPGASADALGSLLLVKSKMRASLYISNNQSSHIKFYFIFRHRPRPTVPKKSSSSILFLFPTSFRTGGLPHLPGPGECTHFRSGTRPLPQCRCPHPDARCGAPQFPPVPQSGT